MELPSNMLTPSIFAEKAKAELEPLGVKVNIYDSDWIKDQKMNAFWSVAKGSTEEPKMVEMIYEGKRSKDCFHRSVRTVRLSTTDVESSIDP